jgi:hypothetical protein
MSTMIHLTVDSENMCFNLPLFKFINLAKTKDHVK